MDIYEQLRRDEGEIRFPYKDTVGKVTIGVGRNLTDDGLSRSEIQLLLTNDVSEIESYLSASLLWYKDLDEARQGVLLNMGFNLGAHGLLGFHNMLTLMEKKDWKGASAAMLDSKWATQVGPRAARLADQLESGEWV